MLFEPYVRFHVFGSVRVIEWPPIGKIAAHSALYKYLSVILFFPTPRFIEWEYLSHSAIYLSMPNFYLSYLSTMI